MDYVMHVKYSSFHRRFFSSFHHCAPTLSLGILARREAYASVLIIKGQALQDSEDVSYKADRLSTISAFPTREKPSCTSMTLSPEFSTAGTRYYACFLNAYSVQIHNNCSLVTWQNQ